MELVVVFSNTAAVSQLDSGAAKGVDAIRVATDNVYALQHCYTFVKNFDKRSKMK
jgi:hypothetical protein